jgi:predicted  nucleic acid-binding Zn-ribbon protein
LLKEYEEIKILKLNVENSSVDINEAETLFNTKISIFEARRFEFEDFYTKSPDFDEDLEAIDSNIKSIEENLEKSNVSLNAINKRKKEIDDLHRQIFGYEQPDDDFYITKVEGIKEELEKAYEKVSFDIKEIFEKINTVDLAYEKKIYGF